MLFNKPKAVSFVESPGCVQTFEGPEVNRGMPRPAEFHGSADEIRTDLLSLESRVDDEPPQARAVLLRILSVDCDRAGEPVFGSRCPKTVSAVLKRGKEIR